MMNNWHRKEKPHLSSIGLGGGIGRNLIRKGFEPGEVEFTTAGSYNWTAPADAAHFGVCVVCVGAGGNGESSLARGFAGGGGGLGWKNNIPVVAGQSYTVVVGGAGGIN